MRSSLLRLDRPSGISPLPSRDWTRVALAQVAWTSGTIARYAPVPDAKSLDFKAHTLNPAQVLPVLYRLRCTECTVLLVPTALPVAAAWDGVRTGLNGPLYGVRVGFAKVGSGPARVRQCGDPAVDGYAHVVPACLEGSPTNKEHPTLEHGRLELEVHVEQHADYDGLAV
eukprot:8781306-Pyramimonas_sp.AAC.2